LRPKAGYGARHAQQTQRKSQIGQLLLGVKKSIKPSRYQALASQATAGNGRKRQV